VTVEYGPNAATGEDEIKNIRMFGGVTFASPSEAAESESAIYALTSELLIMSGNVLVTQGSTAQKARTGLRSRTCAKAIAKRL